MIEHSNRILILTSELAEIGNDVTEFEKTFALLRGLKDDSSANAQVIRSTRRFFQQATSDFVVFEATLDTEDGQKAFYYSETKSKRNS